MSRSRSSFDLSGAIATAASLSTAEAEPDATSPYRGVALVSFGPTAAGPPTILPEPPPPGPIVNMPAPSVAEPTDELRELLGRAPTAEAPRSDGHH